MTPVKWRAWLAFVLTSTAIMLAGVWLFPDADPRVANPVVQGIAFTAGWLLMWPMWVRSEPRRRLKSFPAFAAAMIGISALIAAVRIGWHLR